MKFSQRQVADPAAQQNFEQLESAFPRAGAQTVSWPGGSTTSNVMTVAHGLDRVPTAVLVTLTNSAGGVFAEPATFSYTKTTFALQLQTLDGSSPLNTATYAVVWLAI
jgi:hypothetical protein